MSDHPKGRDQGDAQSKKTQKAAHDAKEAWALYESEASRSGEDCKTESAPLGQGGYRPAGPRQEEARAFEDDARRLVWRI